MFTQDLPITVSAADIAAGQPFANCALSRAFERVFGDRWFWVTRTALVVRVRSGEAAHIRLPQAAVDFLQAFDRGADVQPVTFTLALPLGLLR